MNKCKGPGTFENVYNCLEYRSRPALRLKDIDEFTLWKAIVCPVCPLVDFPLLTQSKQKKRRTK